MNGNLKWFGLKLALLLAFGGFAQQPLNVVTFNIRYDNPRDSLNAWPYRKDKAASQMLFHEAHIVSVQEALHHQLTDLLERMPAFKYTGVGRDDGKQKGEYSAILYDTTRLQLLTSQTFWLSTTPEIAGSKGWDADLPRIVTWAKFRDRKTRKQFFVFNTHFDHIGKVARAESARLLVKKVLEIVGGASCIVTGDFNSTPEQEPIQIISSESQGNPAFLIDTKSLSTTPHYGPTGTFNGFQSKETSDQPIDYIFTTKQVQVLKHATLSQSWNGRFASDHFAVLARVVIK